MDKILCIQPPQMPTLPGRVTFKDATVAQRAASLGAVHREMLREDPLAVFARACLDLLSLA